MTKSTTFQLANISLIEFLKKAFGELYIIALPAIAASFNTSRKNMNYSLSLFFLAVLLSQFFAGPVSDVLGRRKTLLALMPFFILGNLLCFAFPGMITLYLGIVLAGLGIGAAPTLGKAMIYDVAGNGKNAAQRATLFLVITSYVVVWAPAIGMSIGGSLIHLFDWHAVFLFSASLGLLALVISYFTLEESLNNQTHQSTPLIDMFTAYLSFLRDFRFLTLFIALGCLTSGVIAYYSLSTFIYHHELDISIHVIGLFAFYIVGGNMLGKTIALILSTRCSRKYSIVTAAGLMAIASLLMLILAFEFKPHAVAILAPMTIYMTGLGMFMPTIRPYIFERAKDRVGTASSLQGVVIALFISLHQFYRRSRTRQFSTATGINAICHELYCNNVFVIYLNI